MAVSKKKSRKAALQEANLKLTFVPVVFIVLRVWGTLRFLLGNLAQYDAPWISYLQVSYYKLCLQFLCVYKLPDILPKPKEFCSKLLFFYQELSDTKKTISEEPVLPKTNYILKVAKAVTSSTYISSG